MEGLIAGPLAKVLQSNRERLNGLFALARRRSRHLRGEDFGRLLAGPVRRSVDAVESLFPGEAERTARELSELALHLAAGGHLGPASRRPVINEVWEDLLPSLPRLLRASPGALASALTNGAHGIAAVSDAGARLWTAGMRRLAPHCRDAAELLDAGAVLSWRCGMAHYRPSALERWRGLPAPLQRLVLGIDGEGAPPVSRAEMAKRLEDPWHDPSRPLPRGAPRPVIVARMGGFRGFGGPFVEPPLVEASDGSIVAFDRESSWKLFADRFGAVFRRVPERQVRSGGGGGKLSVDGKGRVRTPDGLFPLEGLESPSSQAATERELAVTVSHSHLVTLVALQRGAEG